MDDLDDEQQAEFDRATECYDCNEPLQGQTSRSR